MKRRLKIVICKAFLTIFAKFSDILGRKTMILLSLGIFTVFSIVCGCVSDMTQL
jgi:MFS family permease